VPCYSRAVRKAKDNTTSFVPEATGKRKTRKRSENAPLTTEPKRAKTNQPVGAKETSKANEPKASSELARKRRTPRPKIVLPEDMLRRALAAPTPRSRALWAKRGLSTRSPLDRTTQAMLLRQLYLAHYETEHFEQAADIAEQAIRLEVLPDVAHQDAARARQAMGDIEGAAGHLRLAARLGPPNRKAFHYWTLGSLFFLAKRYLDASAAMIRAARWGTTDKPLYQAHLALCQAAAGQTIEGYDDLIERLVDIPAGGGYGRFVLGLLALYAGREDDARRWLEAFVDRTLKGRSLMAISLRGELEVAREALARLRAPLS